MKKNILAAAVITICLSLGFAAVSFGENINLIVNGNTIDSQGAYVEDGILMVPVRNVADAMGAKTSWNDAKKSIRISIDGLNADFSVGDIEVKTLTKLMDLEKPVVIKNDKAYVPVTLFNYGLDSKVNFDEKSGNCTISTFDVNSLNGLKTVYDTISGSVKAKDVTEYEILSYEIRYAQLDSNSDSAKAINAALKSEAEKTAADFKNDYLQSQTDFYEDCKKNSEIPFRTATLSSDVQIYSNNKYYSVLNTYCYDLGGAHPSSARKSKVFRLSDGKEATAAECTGLKNDEEVKKSVLTGWKAKIAQDKENYYFEDASKSLEEYYGETGFYLNENKVVFYTPLYEIAPYVAGFPEYEMNLK